MKTSDAPEKIILALDRPDAASAVHLLDQLAGDLVWVKIGLQLFTAEGPSIVREVISRGHQVFLDLKFHDIPNTVKKAVASARALGVSMTTIHLAGGPAMMEAAASEAGDMRVLGVTVLTSSMAADLVVVGVAASPEEQVLRLARLGVEHGIQGLVASPREVLALRGALGRELTLVIPGVRPAGTDAGDQSRIATPAQAIRDGADYLVVGRPISDAPSPRDAFRSIAEDIAGELSPG